MPTIKEIAELAGVSRGTVDRVLNKRGGVNPTTEEKVLEIAKALNYKPNLAGTILAAQKKRLMLGVVLLGVGTPFYDDVLSGVRQKAAELESYNCTVVVKHTEYDAIAQLQAIQELVAEGVNGIAITPYNDNRIRKEIHRLFSLGIPVVTLNTDIENTERLAYVGCNFYHSGETAAGLMHLIIRPGFCRHHFRIQRCTLSYPAYCRIFRHNSKKISKHPGFCCHHQSG